VWTEDDAELALAWQEITDRTCTGCGHPIDESMDPSTDGAYDVHPVVCNSCRAVQHRQEQDQKLAQEHPDRIDLAGRRYVAELNEGRRRG